MRILPTLLAAGLCFSLATPALAVEPNIVTYQPVGTPVSGSADQGSAPQLEPGAAQDVLSVTDEDQWRLYKLPEIQDGERIFVSAQLIVDFQLQSTSQKDLRLSAQLRGTNGESCDSDRANTSPTSIENLAIITMGSKPKDSTGHSGCLNKENNELFLALQRDGLWQADTEIPVEIRVLVQPAVDPATLSGQVPEQLPPGSVTIDAAATPVAGGKGFSQATSLASGAVYSDSVLPREVKYYKVHLASGQRLNYRLTVTDSPNASATKLYTGTYNPLLVDRLMNSSAETSLARENTGASISRSTATTVSADLQFEASNYKLAFPGDYYITVTGAAYKPRGMNPLNYELAIDVTGEANDAQAWEPTAEISEQLASESTSWLPSSAQFGALLGGAAVAIAGFAGLWFLRRRKHG